MVEPHLHRNFPALRDSLPFVSLGTAPTPVRRLTGPATADVELWFKDEGAFGDGGWGGNKVRKLEWLIPDVRRRGRDTILTVGGLGTNWGLATALYGAEHGLRTVLALVDQPVDDHVREQLVRLEASGARLHHTHTKARTIATAPWLMARYSRRGRLPYFLPVGGSSPIGVLGYVEVAYEIAAQVRAGDLPEPTHVVCAVGSGGTVAGLALGLRMAGLGSRAVGIVVNDTLTLDAPMLAGLANRAAGVLRDRGADSGVGPIAPTDLDAHVRWLGAGYGHHLPAAETARQQIRADQGIELDPVYTGKAMAGALELLREPSFAGGPVLFVHTDGPRPRG